MGGSSFFMWDSQEKLLQTARLMFAERTNVSLQKLEIIISEKIFENSKKHIANVLNVKV